MSLNQKSTLDDAGQSIGCDPKTNKRNSGLFAFLKWFKPASSRESIDADLQISQSSSCDSLNSTHSAGTVASFSFVPPSAYKKCVSEKCIVVQPETDTYRARLKQRDKRREHDKNLTLRKKYNLFFNRDTLLKPKATQIIDEENSKSLPLMPRATVMDTYEEVKVHRRTNSESSKVKKAGAYLHVKGKRRAPQPPGVNSISTASLRRKKRLAPTPPSTEKIIKTLEDSDGIVYADADIIYNDSLKLDHGILKPAKEENEAPSTSSSDQNSASTPAVLQMPARSSVVEASASPRPWYKRTRDVTHHHKKEKPDNKYEPIEVPEVQFKRNSTLDLTLEEVKVDKKKEEKRKSGLSFLTNISELDREASEIIKNKELEKNGFSEIADMPEFMRPKESKINADSWVSPKRRSARDLIAKFNAITNVTKVTVFGASAKDSKFFGKQTSLDETKRRQEYLLETHKKKIDEIDKKNAPLTKSESASAIKTKPETPKLERKSWKCPKCNLDNEYWRIICHVCSAIKPYFDDFASSSKTDIKPEMKTSSPLVIKKDSSPPKKPDILERSKTQIGFSALANYNAGVRGKLEKNTSSEEPQKDPDTRKEEKEKLKKMLIEMKNSLPKRKSNIMLKQNSRTSVIVENPETVEEEKDQEVSTQEEETVVQEKSEKTQEERVASVLIGTTETIYENIKMRKTDNPKPVKVSSSAQTSGVLKQVLPPTTISKLIKDQTKNSYELMRPKDFEDIYADSNSKSAARVYANLARNDELSLFFNMPKGAATHLREINNTDTIEINRLLRRLETAIAKGDLTEAAMFAQELAQLKVNCSVIRQKPNSVAANDGQRKGIQ